MNGERITMGTGKRESQARPGLVSSVLTAMIIRGQKRAGTDPVVACTPTWESSRVSIALRSNVLADRREPERRSVQPRSGDLDRGVREQGGTMTARQVELVTWRDCVSLGGWQYLSDMSGWAGRVITTVGMIVEETDDDLVLAMSSGDASAGEVLCNWMSIPKSAIMGRVVLRSNAKVSGAGTASAGLTG